MPKGAHRLLVSIHALLAECDRKFSGFPALAGGFQSTHSLRSATDAASAQNTPIEVSIHALLAECDPCSSTHMVRRYSFNPRTPCGVRLWGGNSIRRAIQFQSTHSLRSATIGNNGKRRLQAVSIHALLAECDWCRDKHVRQFVVVSIHALLAECDADEKKIIKSY